MAAKIVTKMVKYIGTADVREIDAAAWKQVGVDDQNKVVWSKSNNFEVPTTELSDAAVKYCDENDSGFVLVDVTPPPAE